MRLPILPQQLIKFLVLSAVLITALFPLSARAQTVSGLEVSPFLIELDVPKGGTTSSHIDLVNRSTQSLAVSITPRDFLPGEEGQPEFVPDEEFNDRTFSLASWINISGDSKIVLQPGELRTVNFTVNPPVNSEQGTHYGAVLFSFVNESEQSQASEVQQSIGTILLVYYGETRENGVADLKVNKEVFWQADKVTFTNLFQNLGNVHVKPKGEVYIKNIFGQIVGTSFINRDAANVLPRTNRGFVSTWYPSSLSFGRYTAESKITYGPNRLEAHDKVVIWILPWYLDIVVIAALIIILWIIFHGRHLHKRRVVKRHLEKNQNA